MSIGSSIRSFCGHLVCWNQVELLKQHRLDLLSCVEGRKYFVVRPQFEQVVIQRAIRVAYLPGSVHAESIVPITGINKDSKRGTRCLIVAAASGTTATAAAAATTPYEGA